MATHRRQKLQAATERLLAGKRVQQVTVAVKLSGNAAESWSCLRGMAERVELSQADLLSLVIDASFQDLSEVLGKAVNEVSTKAKGSASKAQVPTAITAGQ